ncbi:TRAP transporter small permease [Kocuria aegyptia]|uniref:TRAP transporter small permease n=2 Tax=Kocuria aegyptia TaxID=330943 RepID=A0ABN2KQS2_9MICC
MERRLNKIKSIMDAVLLWTTGTLLVVMTLLVLYQVFTRYVLNSPAGFTEELVRYFLVWTGFIGAAYAFLNRHHMALTFVRDRFSPGKRKVLMVAIDVLVLVFALLVMTVGGIRLAISASEDYSALLGISRAVVYAVAPAAGLAIMVAQLLNIWQDVTGIELKTTKEADQ